MKKKCIYSRIIFFIFCFILMHCFVFCKKSSTTPVNSNPQENPNGYEYTNLTGEYLGQNPPGLQPVRFDPGIFREELHSTVVFSPDGNEAYWREMGEGINNIYYVKRINNKWTKPKEVPFKNDYKTAEPFITNDGGKLFFISMLALNGQGSSGKENIWYVDRTSESWGEPVPLGSEVNSHQLHWQVSVAANGNLYFGQLDNNRDFGDIYISRYNGSDYSPAERLSDSINSTNREITETTPYIAPDENFIIFSRVEYNENPYGDLFISFKKNDGTWTKARNMESINTFSHELCPVITPDGKYLFFLSMRNNASLPYWVDAKIIDEYRIQN